MKKILTYVVVATSSVYYAAVPFIIARADVESPVKAAPAAATVEPSSTILYMRVSAYTSVPEETDDTPFITASGKYVRDGIAASNILPFGTKIQIPALFGSKIFTIEDRMSPRIKNTIDLWMASKKQAINFGARRAHIVVVSMPVKAVAVAK